jgi:smad nuclear-interacting protein 1
MHTRSRSPIESNDHIPSVRGIRRTNDKRVDRGRDYDKYRESSSVRDGRDRIPRRNDDTSPNRREYTERHRERERQRDRERYDRRDRDRVNDSSSRARRSASPRSQHPRARERSRSGSPEPKLPEVNKKPNFKPSGLLAAETNTVQAADGTSTVLKYNEPPEARKPVEAWRIYVFKDSEQVGESSSIPTEQALGLKFLKTSCISSDRAHTSLVETS